MQSNRLTIQINKSLHEVFSFTITPPHSTLWIPGVIHEETDEWPVKIGTIYKLLTEKGSFEVTVAGLKENAMVEWISNDKNFHCRYIYKNLGKDLTELEYFEWVNTGDLDEPFTIEVLQKLKIVVEAKK